MPNRDYEGILIRKELTKKHNYRLLIRLNNGKFIFCYTKRFISLNLSEKTEYQFTDSQKNGGKYFFLDRAALIKEQINPSVEEIKKMRQLELKEFQLNQLVKKYKIKDLEQIEKRLSTLRKEKKKNLEYWALLIVKHKKFITNKQNLSRKEKREIKSLNFITHN
jgi:hypothetical protein